ncbi:MAG: hypothetical protein ACR9NN_15210 [Nostochopsis sp.]
MDAFTSTLHPSGLNLFFSAENFLMDLTAEDESIITGGCGSSKSKSKSKSKDKNRDHGCGC